MRTIVNTTSIYIYIKKKKKKKKTGGYRTYAYAREGLFLSFLSKKKNEAKRTHTPLFVN